MTTLVLADVNASTGLSLVPCRRRDAWLARLLSSSLDARLAAGVAPEHSRLLAVRTALLVDPVARHRLARCWGALAVTARAGLPRSQPGVAEVIDQVANRLRTDEPVGVRGVAVARTMLRTTTDAVRRGGPGGEDLAAAVARTA